MREMPSLGRKLSDITHQIAGAKPLRFAFEVVPLQASNLPGLVVAGQPVTAVSVVWEKGAKISFTDAELVQQSTATFTQVMRQSATIYKQGNSLLAKEYSFKVQAVQPTASGDQQQGRRKTIARAKLNLAQFCSPDAAATAPATEVQVPLLPQGTLTLSIRSVWLQHYDVAAAQDTAGKHGMVHSSSCPGSMADMSSNASTVTYDCTWEMDRDTLNSGSAELNRLLQEAEAEHAQKSCIRGQTCSSSAAKLVSLARPTLIHTSFNAHPLTGACSSSSSAAADPSHSGGQAQARPGGRGQLLQALHRNSWAGGVAAASNAASSNGASPFGAMQQQPRPPRHRRASSVPEQPPIIEADMEGGDGMEATTQHPQAWHQHQQPQQQQAAGAASMLLFKRSAEELFDADDVTFDEGDTKGASPFAPSKMARSHPVAMPARASPPSSPKIAAGSPPSLSLALFQASSPQSLPSGGPEALRALSGSMPNWMWPSSRLAVRDVTTDELMRRIGGCKERDVAQLQHIARGLLCERNDWRFKATQAERTHASMQQELSQLRQARQNLEQQVQTDAAMLQQLVEAKLALAQADLAAQDLKGQLTRERERSRQALAKLTSLQSQYDALVDRSQQQHEMLQVAAAE